MITRQLSDLLKNMKQSGLNNRAAEPEQAEQAEQATRQNSHDGATNQTVWHLGQPDSA